ncbi:hypothetical protein TL16_g10311 [Triparma laevis f. inornata]|uniref:Uncharacterized protein n=1 Tax=Triparma laevis f. inornata TaxID=1714386 RepID=A0A9W7BFA7_9STRA|nr:hypothetical protein TL16_g10311 [Triparma laevis f. inornata]
MEQQVLLRITKSDGLGKFRALAKQCSKEFFDDPSLLVAVERRILEVLVLAMPPVVEMKARGKKQQQEKKNDPRKLEILDACKALASACSYVGDFAEELYERVLEGCEAQHGKDHEKMKRCAKGLNICLECKALYLEYVPLE